MGCSVENVKVHYVPCAGHTVRSGELEDIAKDPKVVAVFGC